MNKKQILICVALSIFCILALNNLYAIEVEDEVSGTWTIDDSPVVVLDTIFIPAEDTLMIEPGVIINFNGPYSLLVYGELLAEGAVDDSIVFHSDEDEEFWCGIRADSGAVVTLRYCIVSNCIVGDEDNYVRGSALYCEEAELNISNSTFSDNQCYWWGGAICTYFCHPVTIERNLFIENCGVSGGALSIRFSGDIRVVENLFIDNSALGSGGAIGTWESPFGEFTITGNMFIGNQAGYNGGALSLGHLTLAEVQYNVFSYNSAGNAGGAIYFDHSARPFRFHSNTIVFNESEIGGGICVVANEWSIVSNCIFWGNRAYEGPQVHFYEDVDEVILSYCDIEGEWLEEYSDHVIHEDPQFIDHDNDDFHLSDDSPCIDAGDPESDPDPDGTFPDIGAFFYPQCNINVEPDTVEFVNIQPDERAELELEIMNIGVLPLLIESWTIHPDNIPFRINDLEQEFELSPDSSRVVTISFAPLEEQRYEASLLIESNDRDENILEIPLVGTALGVGLSDEALPTEFAAMGIYPNPFNSSTEISYSIPQSGEVSLRIYDIKGRLVKELVSGMQQAGANRVTWNGLDRSGLEVASGIYLYNISIEYDAGNTENIVNRMVLIR
ncbi:MAG: right-handed parallel beta-helix repeat-containing protein [Candidatus Hatepunaea meridiana]|nr:right-handed parallel beta-helix repeat-containing protein [Candidatus Hatepunaea meridiana]